MQGAGVAACVGGGEIAVDDVGVAVVVEVGAEKIDIAALYKLFGHFLFNLAVGSGEREHIDLKQCARIMKLLIAVIVASVIIKISFGMDHDRAEAFNLQVVELSLIHI